MRGRTRREETEQSRSIDLFLGELEEWATERRGQESGRRDGARNFLEWNLNHRQAALSDLTTVDLDDFFLRYLPTAGLEEFADEATTRNAVCVLLECLAVADGLTGGPAQATTLIAHISAGAESADDGLDESLLDRVFFGGDAAPRKLNRSTRSNPRPRPPLVREIGELPDFVGSDPAAIEASAAASPMLLMIDALADYLRDHRVKLTAAGNITLADARTLIQVLDTGDIEEPVRSSQEYATLQLVDNLACGSGAVNRLTSRLDFNPEWPPQSATERANRMVAAAFKRGVLAGQDCFPYVLRSSETDRDIGHWFIGALGEGARLPFDDFAPAAQAAITSSLESEQHAMLDMFLNSALHGISAMCDALERLGLLQWNGHRPVPALMDYPDFPAGGHVVLTPWGRSVFADLAHETGYAIQRTTG